MDALIFKSKNKFLIQFFKIQIRLCLNFSHTILQSIKKDVFYLKYIQRTSEGYIFSKNPVIS